MICNTKQEFLSALRVALENSGVTDTRDILTDFRQHFEDGAAAGESEADVCRKLGDVDEIIKQYLSDATEGAEEIHVEPDSFAHAHVSDASGFGAEAGADAPPPQTARPAQGSGQFQPDSGKAVGIILLDILIYSWAIPSLAGVIMGLIGTTLGIAGSGIAIFFIGIGSFFADISGFVSTGYAAVSLLFLGIMFMAFGGMLVIACIGAVKGFINICIAIINHHGKVFAGHKLLGKIGKKEVAAQ